MTPIVKMFASETLARDAVRLLAENGVYEDTVFLLTAAPGEEAKAVDAAVASGRLRGAFAKAALEGLRRGRAVVAVSAPFGLGRRVTILLDEAGAVDDALVPKVSSSQAAPFSTVLGMPVLIESRSHTDLASSSFALFPTKLSNKAAPLSSTFGLPTLSGAKPPWKSSFGLPLLTNAAAPFSSMFGMKTLTGSKKEWKSSFGLPLLWDKAAPFSSLLGLPVLTRRRRD